MTVGSQDSHFNAEASLNLVIRVESQGAGEHEADLRDTHPRITLLAGWVGKTASFGRASKVKWEQNLPLLFCQERKKTSSIIDGALSCCCPFMAYVDSCAGPTSHCARHRNCFNAQGLVTDFVAVLRGTDISGRVP